MLIQIYLHGINVLMFYAFVVYLCSLYILLCDVSVAYGPLSQINWIELNIETLKHIEARISKKYAWLSDIRKLRQFQGIPRSLWVCSSSNVY